jgi:hypothetical protein
MIIEQLKFYAVGIIDPVTKKDKLFCWKINSITDLPVRLKYWAQRFEIKAAWYVCQEDGKVIANRPIDMISWYNDPDEDRQVILKDQ